MEYLQFYILLKTEKKRMYLEWVLKATACIMSTGKNNPLWGIYRGIKPEKILLLNTKIDAINPRKKKRRNILWMMNDKLEINIYGYDCKWTVHRLTGKEFDCRYTTKTINHWGEKIMVLRCFTWQDVGLLFYKRHHDWIFAKRYVTVR